VDDIDVGIALLAFREGFAKGASTKRATGHKVEPATHAHWRAGFLEGKRAVEVAEVAYEKQLKGERA
jgi:hypothetical protein